MTERPGGGAGGSSSTACRRAASQARGRPLASAANLLFTGQGGPVVPADTSAPPGYLLEPGEACPGYQSVITSRAQTENLDTNLKGQLSITSKSVWTCGRCQSAGAAMINQLVPNSSRSITVLESPNYHEDCSMRWLDA